MRTSTGQPIRLADYRAPDYWIDHVDLEVSLDRHATRVVSTLSVRPNPQGVAGAALKLDGDELQFVNLQLDGETPAADDFVVSPDQLVLANPPQRPFELRLET